MNKSENLIKLIFKLWIQLTRKRQKQCIILFTFMLITGSFELLNLGLIMPFLYLLQNPNPTEKESAKSILGIVNFIDTSNIFLVASLFIFVLVILGLLRLFVLWYGGEITARIGTDLGSKAYRKVLKQPYAFHLKSNSSNLITTINGHTDQCVGALVALLQLCTASVVLIFILTGLLLINPAGAILSISAFGSLYLLIGYWTKKNLKKNSFLIADALNQQMRALQEGLGGIREIILDNTQDQYYYSYRSSSFTLRTKTLFNQFLSSFPRYSLESLGLISIAILGVVIINSQNLKDYTIPILGTIALAAQRLLPTLQQIYAGWANAKAAVSSFAFLNKLLSLKEIETIKSSNNFKLHKTIEFKSVDFKYEGEKSKYIFNNLNYIIEAGSIVGILGPSGGGKTTFADLLMGLLTPTKGSIFIDGNLLDKNKNKTIISDWRSTIAHVPQNIFLTDNSIASNITFGINDEKIDKTLLLEAASKSQLLDFIRSLPNGFETQVGERGIRLSGGQRQRIGIARALYKKASVIVLDEATSSLDTKNEASVVNAIENLSKEITIIMIAHRISTLKRCHKIIEIKKGKIIELNKKKLFDTI